MLIVALLSIELYHHLHAKIQFAFPDMQNTCILTSCMSLNVASVPECVYTASITPFPFHTCSSLNNYEMHILST